MRTTLIAGAIYFAIVFAIGFILGTARVLAIEPHLGKTWAVVLEGPVILIASWLACKALIRKLAVPRDARARLAMGALAFALLMIAETGLSVLGFGRTFLEHVMIYRTPSGMLGLAGQVVFALFPLIQLWTSTGPIIRR